MSSARAPARRSRRGSSRPTAGSAAVPRTAGRPAGERGHVDAGADARASRPARARSATTPAPSDRGNVAVERDDDGRSVTGAPRVDLRRRGRRRASPPRRARARGSTPRRQARAGDGGRPSAGASGRRDPRFDVAANEPVHEAPEPIGVGRLLARPGTRPPAGAETAGDRCSDATSNGPDRSVRIVHVRARVDRTEPARDLDRCRRVRRTRPPGARSTAPCTAARPARAARRRGLERRPLGVHPVARTGRERRVSAAIPRPRPAPARAAARDAHERASSISRPSGTTSRGSAPRSP